MQLNLNNIAGTSNSLAKIIDMINNRSATSANTLLKFPPKLPTMLERLESPKIEEEEAFAASPEYAGAWARYNASLEELPDNLSASDRALYDDLAKPGGPHSIFKEDRETVISKAAAWTTETAARSLGELEESYAILELYEKYDALATPDIEDADQRELYNRAKEYYSDYIDNISDSFAEAHTGQIAAKTQNPDISTQNGLFDKIYGDEVRERTGGLNTTIDALGLADFGGMSIAEKKEALSNAINRVKSGIENVAGYGAVAISSREQPKSADELDALNREIYEPHKVFVSDPAQRSKVGISLQDMIDGTADPTKTWGATPKVEQYHSYYDVLRNDSNFMEYRDDWMRWRSGKFTETTPLLHFDIKV